jgi:membrane protein
VAIALVQRLTTILIERFRRNDILTYASAIALQLLTAVIPLALLTFLLLGTIGDQDVWRIEWAPKFAAQSSVPTYEGVDAVVEGLISGRHTGWLVGATLIAIWEISGAVRACMGGLNLIFENEETRSIWHRFGLSFAIAIGLAVATLGAIAIAVRGGRWVDLGSAQLLWSIGRWLLVVVLLWGAVTLLFRLAPDAREPVGWVTIGGAAVIVAWIVASLIFGWWVTSVADYKTPFGTAIALLTLVGYLYTSSIVFLVGAQIDQLLIEQAGTGEGPFDGIR